MVNKSKILVIAILAAFVLLPATARAHEGHEHNEIVAATESDTDRGEELKQKLEQFKANRQEMRDKRLTAAKIRVCEKRKDNIEAIMTRSIARAERHIKLFDGIADKVKEFYANKGRIVANYDELVAAVDAAEAKAEADLATLKTQTFECDSDDPKGQAEAYKLAHQTVLQDLKDFRTSVKNLIVGVKSANSEGGE
jgi:hypothetical protein